MKESIHKVHAKASELGNCIGYVHIYTVINSNANTGVLDNLS